MQLCGKGGEITEAYLDNSATTIPSEAAFHAAERAIREVYGNPSSLHKKGLEAMNLLEDARAAIAERLSCEKSEVYFTQAGTVANNTAIFGAAAAMRRRGNQIVTTAFEHPSVARAMESLEKQGFTVVRLKPDENGRITPEQFENAIAEDTVLVSCMAVNNEVGSVQPIESLKRIIKRKKSEALLHVDAVQAFCKIPLKPSKWGIDLMSMSAHKIHGIKGAGALFVKKGVRIVPYILGGGQKTGFARARRVCPPSRRLRRRQGR